MAGYAVLIFTGGRRGLAMQMIAVIFSILGILVGKYIYFFYLYKEMVENGEVEMVNGFSIFDPAVILSSLIILPKFLGGFDILWIVLAVYTAWKIPKGTGIKLPDSQIPSTPYGGSGPNMPGSP